MFSFGQVEIREGSLDEVIEISQSIPEFINPHQKEEYVKRLNGKSSLILVALVDSQLAGFKVGYKKEDNGSFYSWMGGVLPAFRKHGVAKSLAQSQEKWAKQQGYLSIRFKTRNNLKAMLIFGLKNGFNIIDVNPRAKQEENRILLEKNLHE